MTKESVKNSLRVRFGLAPYEPSDGQLKNILKEIQIYQKQGYTNSHIDQILGDIVKKYCPSFGKYKYAVEDVSDLIDAMIYLLSVMEE